MLSDHGAVRARVSMPGADMIRLAASFGLGVGFVEAAVRLIQRLLLGERTFLSREVIWMAPLADLVLFVAAALLLLLVGSLIRRPIPRRLFIASLAFLAFLGPSIAYPRLHPLAGLILAAGAAAVVARAVTRWPALARLGIRSLPGLLAMLVVAFAGLRGAARVSERRALDSLPDVATDDQPNVLLLILDTVRASSLGLYGYGLPTTPGLERIRGAVVFDGAWASAPWTLPSHVGFFTGRHPYETNADWLAPMEPGPLTLSEYLGSRGYVTGGFVGNLIYATYETGLDRGFSRYEDYPISLAMVANSAWVPRAITTRVTYWLGRNRFLVHKTAERINADFIEWLSAHPDRPFFAFLNYMDAHAPTIPPDSLYDRFGPRRAWRARGDLLWREDWTPEDLAAERAAYDASIAYLDQQIAALLKRLTDRGLLDNTLLIVMGDHGEQFGEHDLIDHGNSLYRPLLHVPLIVRPPGASGAQRRVETPVSLDNIPATIADLLGDAGSPFPGRSLRASWTRPDGAYDAGPVLSEVSQGIRMEEWQPAAIGDMRSLVLLDHHYILNGDGREELYALDDRAESRNLVGDPSAEHVLAAARAALDSLTAQGRSSAEDGRSTTR